MAPEAAPAPVAESIADLEARLAAAKASAQSTPEVLADLPPAQEAPAAAPAPAGDGSLPTDAEWRELYAKLKRNQRAELNAAAEAQGWQGHNPTQANMAEAFALLDKILTGAAA